MGVEGLLRNLREIVLHRHLRQYKGKTIAVDTYVWLHKIIKGVCANEHIQGRLSDRFVRECMARIEAMQTLGVNVLMVFDGAPLPNKQSEEATRQQKRQNCRKKAKELFNKGQNQMAKRKLAEAYDVSPDVANRLICVLRERKIPFIVAPYEADAQLAYLSRNGFVDVVMTEDSDLLAYGARCVLFKFDFTTYEGDEITLQNIKENNEPYLRNWTHCMFLSACILSGCDYLPQVRGVGHKSAFQLIGSNKVGRKAIQELKLSLKTIPENYEEGFIKAFLTFRFQRVYCPTARKCVMVNNIDLRQYSSQKLLQKTNQNLWSDEVLQQDLVDSALKYDKQGWNFLGINYNQTVIERIALGFINPQTLELYTVPLPKALKENVNHRSHRVNSNVRTASDSQISKRSRCASVKHTYQSTSITDDSDFNIKMLRYPKKSEVIYLQAEQQVKAPLKKSKKCLLLTLTISAAKKRQLISQHSTASDAPSETQQTNPDSCQESQ